MPSYDQGGAWGGVLSSIQGRNPSQLIGVAAEHAAGGGLLLQHALFDAYPLVAQRNRLQPVATQPRKPANSTVLGVISQLVVRGKESWAGT